MKLPDRELLVHHTGEGWRCPICFQAATVFYGITPRRSCWRCAYSRRREA